MTGPPATDENPVVEPVRDEVSVVPEDADVSAVRPDTPPIPLARNSVDAGGSADDTRSPPSSDNLRRTAPTTPLFAELASLEKYHPRRKRQG